MPIDRSRLARSTASFPASRPSCRRSRCRAGDDRPPFRGGCPSGGEHAEIARDRIGDAGRQGDALRDHGGGAQQHIRLAPDHLRIADIGAGESDILGKLDQRQHPRDRLDRKKPDAKFHVAHRALLRLSADLHAQPASSTQVHEGLQSPRSAKPWSTRRLPGMSGAVPRCLGTSPSPTPNSLNPRSRTAQSILLGRKDRSCSRNPTSPICAKRRRSSA